MRALETAGRELSELSEGTIAALGCENLGRERFAKTAWIRLAEKARPQRTKLVPTR
jgi:hypothetical protein